jgi:CDP-6-deoxy-D-xylo-4-hexulose-3-dehydrase
MVCVNDPKLYDLAKLFRSHGMTREASSELQEHYKLTNPDLNPLFTFAVAGFNMRSSELNAVLGIEQMKRIDHNIERRRENLDIWLEKEKVEYRVGTAGGGNQARQPYLKKFPHRIAGRLPQANYIHDYALYIGNHTDLTKEQIVNLCKKLNNV